MKQLSLSRYINTALLLEQLKRFWPIAALSMLGYVLFIVQPLYFPTHFHPSRTSQDMIDLLTMSNPFVVIGMVAVPFVTALALFSYPYRVASATAYHSFPVNRAQLFFTHVLAGLLLIVVPLLLLSLALLMPVSFVSHSWHSASMTELGLAHGSTINTIPRLIGFFLRNALGFTLYFAIFTLAASLAGNRVIAVILSVVIALAPLGIMGLGEAVGSFYVFGFGMFRGHVMENVAQYSNPVAWMTAYNNWGRMHNPVNPIRPLYPFFISYSLITLAGFGLAFLAYRLRPQERAGDTIAFLAAKRVFIFLLALGGMVTFGVFLLSTTGSRIGYYIGFIVGFIITYFIAQMMAEKTFRVGHKVKDVLSYGAVAIGLYIALLLVVHVGLWGYVRHVPPPQQVTGVFVSRSWAGARQSVEDHFFTGDPYTIEWAQAVHQGAIQERGYLQRARWGRPNLRPWSLTPFSITYRLADGRIIHRSYMLTGGFITRHNVNELMNSPAVLLSNMPALARPEVIEFINFYVHGDSIRQQRNMSDFEQARITADAEGISIAEVLGDRAYIMNFALNHSSAVLGPQQVAGLAEAIAADISAWGSDGNWRNTISFTIVIYNRYLSQDWGSMFISVPFEGYAGTWLRDNGFLLGFAG